MPPRSSLSFRNSSVSCLSSPARPDQFTFIARLDDRMRHDGARPLEGVDLGHHRRVDQPSLREELGVGPVRMLRREQIADVVVLIGEERVEHRQTDPPVVGEPAEVQAGVGIDRKQAGGLHAQLAADARAQLRRGGRVAPVNLRRVPPVAVEIRVGRGVAWSPPGWGPRPIEAP